MEEVPRFIKLRGCINCVASKNHKERTGHDYGFDHEDTILCILDGCWTGYRHALHAPFIDPEEAMRLAKKSGEEKPLRLARGYVLRINNKFGHFYERIGVNLNQFLEG